MSGLPLRGGRVEDQPNRLVLAFRAADRVVLSVNRWAMILCLAVMAVLIFANVVLRYLVHDGVVWAEEIGRYLMVWLTFIGIGPVLRVGGHMAIDALPESLPPRFARPLRLFIVLLVALFLGYFAYLGLLYAQKSWIQTMGVTGFPFSYVSVSIAVGFGLSLWHLAACSAQYIQDGTYEVSADLDPEQAASL